MSDATTDNIYFPMWTDGKPERIHLYRWMRSEEPYVSKKFGDDREFAEVPLRENYDASEWRRQVNQYYDRAADALAGAFECRQDGNTEDAEFLEMKAKQAVAKACMTAKGFSESMIRTFGQMPKPGLSSGYIEEWSEPYER